MDNGYPLIRGQLVWLRAIERKDLEEFARGCNDNEIGFPAGFHAPNNFERIEQWYDRVMKENHYKDAYYFTICELGSDEAIGFVYLWHLDMRNCNGEFSILISNKEYWGKGYGTDALNAIQDFGFGELPLERIYLLVQADNTRAIRSYEKANMVKDGVLRNHWRRRGSFVDKVVMSMLRDEWMVLPRPKRWELT
jgi:RimJ/RimL family protein N-acetyltransferase